MNDQFVQASHRIAYSISGQGPRWLVMSHSLGCCKDMWAAQVAEFGTSYRVLTYDLPGHGDSETTERKGSLDNLAEDLLTTLDALGVERAHFVGISIGGMIGQVAALAQPERFHGLVLANTSGQMPESTHPDWLARIAQARSHGVGSLAGPSLERWFTPEFRSDHPAVIEALAVQFARTAVPGYAECCEAIMGLSTISRLPGLRVPTLVISGSRDVGAPPAAARALQSQLPNGRLAVIDGAGHLSCIDHPHEFNTLCSEFLGNLDRTANH